MSISLFAHYHEDELELLYHSKPFLAFNYALTTAAQRVQFVQTRYSAFDKVVAQCFQVSGHTLHVGDLLVV